MDVIIVTEHSELDLIEVNPYADFKIDDKVIVKDNGDSGWIKAHFSHIGDDNKYPFHVFVDGVTSFTTEDNDTSYFQECVKREDRTDTMRIWK